MRKILSVILLIFAIQFSIGQELNASVSVNADRMTDVNPQIFKNLETKVRELLNTTKWTDEKYLGNEKIDCNFFINVSKFNNNNFEATLQVQSTRPIFNSTYSSPVININDKDFNFRFLEFEQLVYDQNSFTSNLVSVLAFYANVIIGLDKDTFEEMSGTTYLTRASNIVNVAQTSGYAGWAQNSKGNNNRYFLITDLLSNTYKSYRKAIYLYHNNGLDVMHSDLKKGKEEIANSISELAKIQKIRPNAILTRGFFDAKTDEIVQVFTGGPTTNNSKLLENLNRISPLNSSKWNKIR